MNTTFKRSLVGAAAVAATAASLTGPASAYAAPTSSPGTTLGVAADPGNSANYIVTIRGLFPMSEGAAYDRLNHIAAGGGMDYVIYADDPGEGDSMIGSPHGYLGAPGPTGGLVIATPNGIAYMRTISVPRSALNEDEGTDEIYASARFVQGGGAGDLRAFTVPVSADF
ncbi:hypothetical protein [Mycolicibacterium iranicum]|uniref:MPT63-like domain-containing protein n=1 Tax=Mycolicibacterium iranicum TaxID=912594 RepID=A0A178LYZ3_MYCIR|nr:hypothetical protein [Mycolicibacterium iranicum]OAN40106.1 hypothetical protein A4X20_15370 [Mycolicibacterium iranicum]